jgi:Phosphoenolpyruvate phosphomutase
VTRRQRKPAAFRALHAGDASRWAAATGGRRRTVRIAGTGAVGGSIEDYDREGEFLYVPGLETVDQIRAVCESVTRPVNVLARPGLSFTEIAGAGARRVSVGGSLTWVAVRAMADVALAIREEGDFRRWRRGSRWTSGAPSPADGALRASC